MVPCVAVVRSVLMGITVVTVGGGSWLLTCPATFTVCVRVGSWKTVVHAVGRRYKLPIKFAISLKLLYTDTGPTSPSIDLPAPGIWLGSH